MKHRLMIAGLLCYGAVFAAHAQFAGNLLAPPASPLSSASAAAKPSAVSVRLVQQKVVKDAHGNEKLTDATTVKPGDVVEYQVIYTNTSKDVVKRLDASLPIPEGLDYVPKSARPMGDRVTAATKDGQFSAEPLMRKLSDGRTEPIPYEEYRTLRWSLGRLGAGATVTVSARARVETVKPIGPASSVVATPQTPAMGRP